MDHKGWNVKYYFKNNGDRWMHKKVAKKIKELHDDPSYSEDQRQLYRDINREQWTTRKTWHIIKKQKSIYLGTRICIFFSEQGTTIILALAALSVTI